MAIAAIPLQLRLLLYPTRVPHGDDNDMRPHNKICIFHLLYTRKTLDIYLLT